MKPQDTKNEFVRLRAEGRSFRDIAKKLNVSRSTCAKWEAELESTIAELKQDQLQELYDNYYMTKEARIKKLGETLESIEGALGNVDLNQVPPEKLLDFKLKYTEALKGEYHECCSPFDVGENIEPKNILKAMGNLYNRVQRGTITTEQANRESIMLTNLLKAYDVVELKAKLDALETIIESRR